MKYPRVSFCVQLLTDTGCVTLEAPAVLITPAGTIGVTKDGRGLFASACGMYRFDSKGLRPLVDPDTQELEALKSMRDHDPVAHDAAPLDIEATPRPPKAPHD